MGGGVGEVRSYHTEPPGLKSFATRQGGSVIVRELRAQRDLVALCSLLQILLFSLLWLFVGVVVDGGGGGGVEVGFCYDYYYYYYYCYYYFVLLSLLLLYLLLF